MELSSFATLLTFTRFRSYLYALLENASCNYVERLPEEAIYFFTYLQSLKVSALSNFIDALWDFNADYPNASRHIRGAKLRIDFSKYPNIPDVAKLEIKTVFIVVLKGLVGIPGDGPAWKEARKLPKPNTIIAQFESGMRFLDKVFSLAAHELGQEHIEREMYSIQSLPAHCYASAAKDFDYVFDHALTGFFKSLRSGDLQGLVFSSSLPNVDLSTLEWKQLGASSRPMASATKKKQILPNDVFELSSQAASLSIVDFLDAMHEEVVDVASLNRRNAKNYFPANAHGLCPLKFNVYIYKRLAQKGFTRAEVKKKLDAEITASSEYFGMIAPQAVKQYSEQHGTDFGEEFRLYLNFVNYSCMYIIGQYTGMRPSEYSELIASSCLRFDGKYWLLRSNVSKHQDNLVELFDDFWLAIPIVRDAVRVSQLLNKYKNNDFIFSNVDTVRFGEVAHPFSSAGTKLALDSFFSKVLSPAQCSALKFNAYMMRHTLAYQLFRADVGLPFISHQLKHFGDIVGVAYSDRGFSKTTLGYGEIGIKMTKGGGRNASGSTYRRDAQVESMKHRFDPDGSYAGVNAATHKENMSKVFRGYMASGYTKEEVFEAMADQHIAVISVGQGFCYGGSPSEFDSSIPCIGGLRCNPNECSNAVVSKVNAPAWRNVYYQNKAALGNPDLSHTHVQNKAAMDEAYGVLQLLEEEL